MRRSAIQRQSDELKARIHRHADRRDEDFRVGVEIEICLLDGRGRPVDAGPVIEALQGKHDVDYEYGMSQLEFKTEPVPMDGIEGLNLQFEGFIEDLEKAVDKVHAGATPVFLGAR